MLNVVTVVVRFFQASYENLICPCVRLWLFNPPCPSLAAIVVPCTAMMRTAMVVPVVVIPVLLGMAMVSAAVIATMVVA